MMPYSDPMSLLAAIVLIFLFASTVWAMSLQLKLPVSASSGA